MGARRKGRRAALQMLHQMDASGVSAAQAIGTFEALFAQDDDELGFAFSLVRAYDENRERIDTLIANASHHWRMERMAIVDRNILRMATANS
ncbi:MAG: transcription antitermination protein NusB [Polyangiales bacterium]